MTNEEKKQILEKVNRGETVVLPEGASIEVLYYDIKVHPDMFHHWKNLITNNEKLLPEILGYLLGKAEAIKIVKFPEDKK